MDLELVKEIFAVIGASFCLVLMFVLIILFIYIALAFTMKQNDKEIEYVESLSEEEKQIVLKYKQAKLVRFKELLKKKGKKDNEDK